MKWIDQAAYSCAINWTGAYCVIVYLGGLQFVAPIHVGELVGFRAFVIRTGRTHFDIAVDVYAGNLKRGESRRTRHCVIVFVAVDAEGKPFVVPVWQPSTSTDRALERYAGGSPNCASKWMRRWNAI